MTTTTNPGQGTIPALILELFEELSAGDSVTPDQLLKHVRTYFEDQCDQDLEAPEDQLGALDDLEFDCERVINLAR